MTITMRYQLFPLARVVRKNGRALKTSLGDEVVRGGTIPYKPIDPDFWTFCDVQEFIGKTVDRTVLAWSRTRLCQTQARMRWLLIRSGAPPLAVTPDQNGRSQHSNVAPSIGLRQPDSSRWLNCSRSM